MRLKTTQTLRLGGATIVVLLCAMTACDRSAPATENTICESPSAAYDGVYGVSFYVGGEPSALGSITIADGRFEADIRGHYADVQTTGCVLDDGTAQLETLDSAGGEEITASARLADGVLTGSYSVTEEATTIEGVIEGSLNNRIQDDSHTGFDGIYDIHFSMDGATVSTATLEVDNSGFMGQVETSTAKALSVQGFVSSDGVIVLTGVTGSLKETLAEGHIDQDSFEASGVFRFGEALGTFLATRREP
jgi:hypothetical protein